jgi:hypothetical protein
VISITVNNPLRDYSFKALSPGDLIERAAGAKLGRYRQNSERTKG